MKNLKHWKVGVITAVIIGSDEISLFSQKEIKSITAAIKKCGSDSTKINMAGEVKVKIDFKDESRLIYRSDTTWEEQTGLGILIKSAEFPDPNKWYHLRNFYSKHIGTIIKQCKFDRETGEFKGTFSPIVSSSADLVSVSSLVSESMVEYDEYLEETIREMNCEVNKKTKKWVIGHRYDSIVETRYLLCKTKIRKNTSDTYPEHPEDDAWIYTNHIGDFKTIDEVLKSKIFGEKPEDLKIMTTIPNGFVESGQVLENNFTGNINEYMKTILEISKDITFPNLYLKEHNFYYYILPYFILDTTEDWAKTYLSDAVYEFGRQCIYTLWNRKEYLSCYGQSMDRRIGEDKSPEENISILQDLMLYRIPDKNIEKIPYYTKLFQTYGVDLNAVCEKLLLDWNPRKFTEDLDSYLENFKYIQIRKPVSLTRLDVRVNSKVNNPSLSSNTKKLKELIGEGDLYNTIQEMIASGLYSIDKNLGGSKDYVYKEVDIELQDLLNYIKQKFNEIPEDLKNEILIHQFCSLHLMYDADKTIE